MQERKRRLRYSDVAATLALVVSLGGVSYAAVTLPKNSVGSPQIKAGAVKRADIKANAVTSDKVKDGSLTGFDVDESTLGGVPNANALGGAPAGAYAKAAQPAFTLLALAPGVTPLASGYATPGYLVDTLGFVHLTGSMNCPADGVVFTLPVGARPTQTLFAPVAVVGGGNALIRPSGAVEVVLATVARPCSVDGITFKP